MQVSVDNYIEWIELVAQFTINSLKSWQWASASVYYLLGLWSRLVSSTPYLKGGKYIWRELHMETFHAHTLLLSQQASGYIYRIPSGYPYNLTWKG